MNPEAQAKLDEILRKDPSALSFGERAFLRARSPYLTSENKRVFADVLDATDEVPENYGAIDVAQALPADPALPVEANEPTPDNDDLPNNGINETNIVDRDTFEEPTPRLTAEEAVTVNNPAPEDAAPGNVETTARTSKKNSSKKK